MVTTYSTTKEDGTDWSWQTTSAKRTSPSTSPWPQCSTYSPRMTHHHTMDRIHCHTDPPTSRSTTSRKRKWWQRLHMTKTEELPRLCCKKGSWTSQKRTGMKDEKKHIEITHVMPSIRSTPRPYAISIAEARLEEEREEMRNQEWLRSRKWQQKSQQRREQKTQQYTERQQTRQQCRKQHERGTKQNKKTREPEQAETTNARSSAPSRRCPGKVPAGLTKPTQSLAQRSVNKTPFYFNKRHTTSLDYRRRTNRRAWRHFKRTRLWERANQVAKKHFQKSTLPKRQCLKKLSKKYSFRMSRSWFKDIITCRK